MTEVIQYRMGGLNDLTHAQLLWPFGNQGQGGQLTDPDHCPGNQFPIILTL